MFYFSVLLIYSLFSFIFLSYFWKRRNIRTDEVEEEEEEEEEANFCGEEEKRRRG